MNNKKSDWGWQRSTHPISRELTNSPFSATTVGQEDAAKRAKVENQTPTLVRLPSHLFIPEEAQSLDIRRAADIAALTLTPVELMSFTCPPAAYAHFIAYAVFSDGQLAANQEFIPKVDGAICFPYQGDPDDNFRINLGLAPDLSNNALIQCQLSLQPGQKLTWEVINRNAVDVAMGVRMRGYVDFSQKRVNNRSNG